MAWDSYRSLTASLLIHAAAFLGLMNAPALELPARGKSEYKQAIEGKEHRLVWYKFDQLPEVSPRTSTETKPPRAEHKASQAIVASPKKALKRTQIVWTPAPELSNMPPLESPNLLAVRMPARPFLVPPGIVRRPTLELPPIPDAPVVSAPLSPLKLGELPKIARRFVAPPTQVPRKLRDIEMPTDAPQIMAAASAPTDALDYKMKAPTRPFSAPPSRPKKGVPQPAQLEAPPSVAPDVLNLAVVGLHPSIKAAPPPSASSPANLSAGPVVRNKGADTAGDGKGLNVPDLFVQGARDLKSELRAQANASPSSQATLRQSMRMSRSMTGSRLTLVPPRSAPMRVATAPDRRFDGRDVYMMAIQMPNLTSSFGSWLMWYTERTAHEAWLAPISPPVAHRKVDPKYIASAVADRIQGKILLGCVIGKDGHVADVEIVQGLENRLNASAVEALRKWEFDPATRGGEPVEVDVLVQIPFSLDAPKTYPY